ncbi:MAG: chloramphenicol acetyltransferase [Marinibacterium sp.]|nr:chloramphenicol acetyltransferase [Marinibacterium sp.]
MTDPAKPKLSADTPLIHDGCAITNSRFGRYVEIGADTRVSNAVVGDYSYCDRSCDIANARIGKFANIASFVRIGATDHPLDKASLHHFLYRSADYWPDAEHDADWFAHRASRGIVIGHDTWIGHNAQIKPEITIGHGAVIASGAIVTRDVAPYTIVAGVSATVLRRRLPQALADRMIGLAWWDWDHATLRTALPDFRRLGAEAFLEAYGG